MGERKEVAVTVLDIEQYETAWPARCNSRLSDVMGWFWDVFLRIPEEWRDSTVCEIDGSGGYGGDDSYARIHIHYRRPETDQEREQRRLQEDSTTDMIRKKQIATLRELRAMYPDVD